MLIYNHQQRTNNPDTKPEEREEITIDNYFIHEKYESIFNGGFDIEPETLESVISHEIAHRYKFRHCKAHSRITREILEKYNSL